MKNFFIKLLWILCIISEVTLAQTGKTYVFVSFSLNDEALKAYYMTAEKTGAVLVMRGLIDDSFMATKAKLEELKIEYIIDPELFVKYNVTKVPTIVQDNGDVVRKVTGHIPLLDAIKIFNEEAS
jgi:conjugal transfer pilus assembly protein TrbC